MLPTVLFESASGVQTIDRLVVELERATGRRVNLGLLGHAPPLLAHEVVASDLLLVCRDEFERGAFVARAQARHLDTATSAVPGTPTCVNAPRASVPVRAEAVRKKLLEIEEAIGRLAARGVITETTNRCLESLAGFRNMLVHDHATADLQRVRVALARLDDFRA